MKLTPFQRWLAVALTLWVIPATLFWLGMGLFLRVNLQEAVDSRLRHMARTLDERSVQKEEFLEKRLNRLFDECSGLDVTGSAFREKITLFLKQAPHGLFRISFFDDTGRILLGIPADPAPPPGQERLFQFIRVSWLNHFPLSPTYFEVMKPWLPGALGAATTWRGREGELCQLSNPVLRNPNPSWGLYRLKKEGPGRIGGMLAIVYFAALPEDYVLKGHFGKGHFGECLTGYSMPGLSQACSTEIPQKDFVQIVESYDKQTGRRFLSRGYLVEGRPYDGSAVVFAMTPFPQPPWGWLIGVFSLYGILSFFGLVRLFGILAGGDSWQWTLGKKLTFLFLWGVAFPLGAASSLASLYIQEKRGDLVSENRQAAFATLKEIDEGYERYLGHRERYYRSLVRDFRRGTLSMENLQRAFEALLDAGAMEAWYVTSSDTLTISGKSSRRIADFRHLLSLPLESRFRILGENRWKGWFWDLPMYECLAGRVKFEDLEHRAKGVVKTRDQKIQAILAEEAFKHVNSRMGKTGEQPSPKPKVGLDSLMDEGHLILLRLFKVSLGKLLEGREVTMGYTFNDVLIDSTGDVAGLLITNHSFFNFQKPYLDLVLAESERKKNGAELCALWFGSPFNPDYPSPLPRPLVQRHFRLQAAGASSQSFSETLDGRSVEVTAFRPKALADLLLFHITPLEVLEARLRPFKVQAGLVTLAAVLFSLLLGAILLEKFLIPLYGLSEGIQALRKKQFGHRVPVQSNDEFGHLGEALNQTIGHMKSMEMASSIQSTLYPSEYRRFGAYEIFGKNIMTQGVGGDYFDYLPLPDGRLAIILGDVSGHGFSAALVTAMAKGGFTVLCPRLGHDPVEIMKMINFEFLKLLKRRKMMTCFLGILDPEKEVLTVVNGGQCFPVLIEPDGTAAFVEMISNPLGLMKKPLLACGEISLAGKTLVLYSDGFPEAVNLSSAPLGYERFTTIAKLLSQTPGEIPTETIFREVRKFTDPVPWGDDATLLVIRRAAGAGA
jgi:serine phosphatase RsbU (regulator of sigma subunit)